MTVKAPRDSHVEALGASLTAWRRTCAFLASVLMMSVLSGAALAQSGYNWKRKETQQQTDLADVEEAHRLTLAYGILAPRFPPHIPNTMKGFMELLEASDPYTELLAGEATFTNPTGDDVIEGFGLKLIRSDGRIIGIPRLLGPVHDAHISGAFRLLSVDDTVVTAENFEALATRLADSETRAVHLTAMDLENGIRWSETVRKAPYNPVSAAMYTQYGANMIQILDFTNGRTADEVNTLLGRLSAHQPLILDLRYATGGQLKAAVEVANLFLGASAPIGEAVDKEGTVSAYSTAAENRPRHTGPMILLTSNNTASAAEFLTQALVADRDVILIGESTFGKCFAQRTFKLPSGRYFRLSVAGLRGAESETCNAKGITPNYQVSGDLVHATYELVRRAQLVVRRSDQFATPTTRVVPVTGDVAPIGDGTSTNVEPKQN